MTAGTAEKVYRLHDGRITPAAGAVLTYLAYRAYYESGRCAWPAIDTIAACCFMSRRTVLRAIDLLKELGYVRVSPDQRWNERDPETGEWKRKSYRSTVYDVLAERFRDVEPESAEQVRDAAGKNGDDAGEVETCQNVTPAKSLETSRTSRRVRMSPLDPGQDRESDILSATGCQNVTQPTSNQLVPPTPSGCPPASGEEPLRRKAGGQVGGSVGTVSPELRVCALLADARRRNGLSVEEATGRDLRSIRRLFADLGAEDGDPAETVGRVVDWVFAAGHVYWQRRIRTGRQLAALFGQIRDDMLLDRRDATPDGGSVPDSRCASGHSADCEHIHAIADAPAMREIAWKSEHRHAHDEELARLANSGMSREELERELARMLTEDRRTRIAGRREREAEHAARRARNREYLARGGGFKYADHVPGGAA